MTLRPYKFRVQAVVQEIDDQGNVIGERSVTATPGEPFEIYGCEALSEWATAFPDTLAAAAERD